MYMKQIVLDILNEYLKLYPEEKERQKQFYDYLQSHNSLEIVDWNNFVGHLVAGAFIYARKTKRFLFLYHKDLKMYLYPGGHASKEDKTPLDTALRECTEETGLIDFKVLSWSGNSLIPLDIDTQHIAYNERLNLPSHYHYDFRYVFIIEDEQDIKIDTSESRDYKWLDYDEFINMSRYATVKDKLIKVIKDNI